MKVTTERLDNCQVNVIVEMEAAEIEPKLRETARKISRQFTVPGYRRGRAPYQAVVRVFGRESLQQQTLEDFGNELYDKALEQIDYVAYQAGELKDVEWDPFRMTVLLPIQPEVNLGDYRAVRVPFAPEAVTEERVAEYLEELRRRHAQWVPVDRPAALGDRVVLDMKGTAGDETIMDNEDHEILLEAKGRHPLPGFHEQIVGMSAGDDKTFVLAVPEDDAETKAAGQQATVTVHLHTVKQEELPSLDDELAMMVGDYDSLEALKIGVRENLETEASQKAESEYLDQVLEAMIKAATKIEYPPQAVDRETDLILGQTESNLASLGLKLDKYLAMLGKSRETHKRELRPSAEERLRKRLVLTHIAEREKVKVDPSEVDAEIDRMSDSMGDQATAMREMLSSPEGRLTLANDLVMTRVQERVILIGKGEAPPPEEEEAPDKTGAVAEEPAPAGSAEEPDLEPLTGVAEVQESPANTTVEEAGQEGDPEPTGNQAG